MYKMLGLVDLQKNDEEQKNEGAGVGSLSLLEQLPRRVI